MLRVLRLCMFSCCVMNVVLRNELCNMLGNNDTLCNTDTLCNNIVFNNTVCNTNTLCNTKLCNILNE